MPRNSKTEKVASEQSNLQPVVEKTDVVVEKTDVVVEKVDVKKQKATKKVKVEKVLEATEVTSTPVKEATEVTSTPVKVEEANLAEKPKKQRAVKKSATPSTNDSTNVLVEASGGEVKDEKEEDLKEDDEKVDIQQGGRKIRYFKCIYGGTDENINKFGRFCGYKPKQAANKALTSILKVRRKNNENLFDVIPFSMIECTRGKTHKVSKYTGQRLALENPIIVKIKTGDGQEKEIKYHFTNKVNKVKAEKPVKADKKDTKKKVKKSTKSKKAKKSSSTKKETTQS